MGSSVKSATKATTKAIRDTRDTVQKTVRKVTSSGLREEVSRATAVLMPTAYAGNALAVGTYENGGDLMAGANKVAGDLGLGGEAPVPVADPNASIADQAASVADPQQKRRRQLAGRAGTLLTGGTSGNGTTLGGTGGRSTLLGL